MYTHFKTLFTTQMLTKKRTTLTLMSILFITLLISSVFTSAFRISPFAAAANIPDVIVTDEFELRTAISVATPDLSLTIIALDRNIVLSGSPLVISEGKCIQLISIGGTEPWKLFGANNQVTITVDGVLVIDGIVVTHTGAGRGITVNSDGNFTMVGGVISGNAVSGVGGGVYNIGNFTMVGGVISDNAASVDGGGVYNIGNFTMVGGVISDNTAGWGGGVYNQDVFMLVGGVISGNEAVTSGGGVFSSGVFEMFGGEISYNAAKNFGAGVFNDRYAVFTMYDGVIAHNKVFGDGGDGGGVRNNAFAVFMMFGGVITDNTADWGGGVGVGSDSYFCLSDGVIADNTANYYGGGVTCNSDSSFEMLGGVISGNTASSGGGVYDRCSFEMFGGEIVDNIAHTNGAGVYTTGLFVLNGGTISKNTAANSGGGVYKSGGSFEMFGGEISSNVAYRGGGVYLASGTFSLFDGVISDNTAEFNGGGIWITNSRINLGRLYVAAGVVFSNNSASKAYTISNDDITTYNTQIHSNLWTTPFTNGYNNYDISYVFGNPNYIVEIRNSYAASSGAGLYLEGEPVIIDAGVRAGYVFSGWLIDDNTDITLIDENATATQFTMPPRNVILTAQWTPIDETDVKYSMVYDGNGASGGVAPVDVNSPYLEGSVVVVLGEGSLVRDGFVFLGWSTDAGAVVPSLVDGDWFTIWFDVELFAVWQREDTPLPQLYTVTFAPGVYGIFEPQVTTGLSIGDPTPKAPEVTGENGWKFTGWNPTPTQTVTCSIVYTAQWEPIDGDSVEYIVHYYLQGTTTKVADSKNVTGQIVGTTITETAITIPSYTAITPTSITTTLNATGNVFVFYYTANSNNSGNNGNGGRDGSSQKPPTTIQPPIIAEPPTTLPPNITLPPDDGDKGEPLMVWALVNLILSIAGIILAIILTICVLLQQRQVKRVKNPYVVGSGVKDDKAVKKQKRMQIVGLIVAFALAIAGVIVFLLTENMSYPMVMVNKWTIVNAVLFIVELVTVVFVFKSKSTFVSKQEERNP